MRVDLITGFLGAGKTTFIRKYFAYLQSKGEKVRIIENEFGSVSVDTRFLEDMTDDIDDLTDADFARFENAGYFHERHNRMLFDHKDAYSTFMFLGNFADEAELRDGLKNLFAEPQYGKVLRVKGFLRDRQKNLYEVNCTKNVFSVKPATVSRGIGMIIGQDLNEEKLKETFA